MDRLKNDLNQLHKKLGVKGGRGIVNDLIIHSLNKVLPDDDDAVMEKILGMELTHGQHLILLQVVFIELAKVFRSQVIQEYDLMGKDKKAARTLLEKQVALMFLSGLMETESGNRKSR